MLPDRILIYRDGVGDGQISQVHDYEVEAILNALKELYGEPPKLALIIVTKRIGTRSLQQRIIINQGLQ